MTTLTVTPLTMPGVALGTENPLPRFRDRITTRPVSVHANMPARKLEMLGSECGLRVLPYRMQETYTRQRVDTTYETIVLENETLRATFLPAVGGRLLSLFHIPLQRELLNRNPVYQPANLAIRNAWFSGGIEWNVSQYGHTFGTCSPVYAGAITGADGEPGLRLYEYERCKNLFWQIDFYLPPGSPWLIAHTRIANPNDDPTSMYWWTNTAVDERPDVRVLAPTKEIIYTDLTGKGYDYAYGEMPVLSTFDNKDASYSLHSGSANEYFFQPDDVDMPWEAALGADGSGFIEASTAMLRYRKMFCWGSHQGGRHWQDFLAPGGTPYLEIQAGLAPSQLHGLTMPARADWHWTQVFGHIQGDPAMVHHPDWQHAWQGVDRLLKGKLSSAQLQALDAQYTARADMPASTIIQHGSGWGALELERRAGTREPAVSAAFVFPGTSFGPEQRTWQTLLRTGQLPTQDPTATPGAWMVQPAWRTLLEQSASRTTDWYALLHLGVMRLEHFDSAGARAAFEASIAIQPSAWAWRNLAVLARWDNDTERALAYLANAWQLNPTVMELAQEYMELLCAMQRFAQAHAVYQALPAAVTVHDRIQILHARIALELGDEATVERLMQHEYAVVREGETELTDIWFGLWYRRAQGATQLSADQQREIRRRNPPPAHIDFRAINKE